MRMLDAVQELGAGLTGWTERYIPDSWVLCMALTVGAGGLAVVGPGVAPFDVVLAWGDGMWKLLELAMQFSIAMVAAYACVSSRAVFRVLDRLAGLPDPHRPLQAIALAASFSLVTSYLNWAFSLVGCALLVPFLCRRNPNADVRLVVAASFIGIGTVWHGGFSGSAPLILATPGNPLVDPASGAAVVDRIYPVTETLFQPFNFLYMAVVGTVATAACLALHPKNGRLTFSEAQLDAIMPAPPEVPVDDGTPRTRIEGFRGWVWLAAGLMLASLGHSIVTRGFGTSWTINAYNMVFLSAALLLHGEPRSFLAACRRGMDTAWGIVIQFPFYAGIFGIMVGTGLGDWIGGLFAEWATTGSYPFVVYVYSGFMNLFVPSAGSKWLIEAPFLIPAGEALDVSTVTVLLAYAYGDSTTNLIQPFWAIPILAVTRLRFGDVVGYLFLIALACFAVSTVAMLLIPARL